HGEPACPPDIHSGCRPPPVAQPVKMTTVGAHVHRLPVAGVGCPHRHGARGAGRSLPPLPRDPLPRWGEPTGLTCGGGSVPPFHPGAGPRRRSIAGRTAGGGLRRVRGGGTRDGSPGGDRGGPRGGP